MDKKTEEKMDKKQKVFERLYKNFYKKCVKEGVVPVPMMGTNARSIYAYLNFQLVPKGKEKELLKDI